MQMIQVVRDRNTGAIDVIVPLDRVLRVLDSGRISP